MPLKWLSLSNNVYLLNVCFTGEDFVVSSLFHSQDAAGVPPEFSSFLNRCFISRVRCLLDSTSGFLVSDDHFRPESFLFHVNRDLI